MLVEMLMAEAIWFIVALLVLVGVALIPTNRAWLGSLSWRSISQVAVAFMALSLGASWHAVRSWYYRAPKEVM